MYSKKAQPDPLSENASYFEFRCNMMMSHAGGWRKRHLPTFLVKAERDQCIKVIKTKRGIKRKQAYQSE